MQPRHGNEGKEEGFVVRDKKYASHAYMREGKGILDERNLKIHEPYPKKLDKIIRKVSWIEIGMIMKRTIVLLTFGCILRYTFHSLNELGNCNSAASKRHVSC